MIEASAFFNQGDFGDPVDDHDMGKCEIFYGFYNYDYRNVRPYMRA